ncbi:uncharacterized protein RCO7_00620 [Rhynchosporium graminicola]|uniref:2EXR domain-containing protein n=1 Tax=Rhynchosporium graminicola TaxID=2792576 RepID=A0A1E1KMZ8_9HELO|nr:uncharacterized protein RCO7_00620 [Rhynchosporium commune]
MFTVFPKLPTELRDSIWYFSGTRISCCSLLSLQNAFSFFKDIFTQANAYPQCVQERAIVPRLVHWRPGGGKALGILHASNECHNSTRGRYMCCHITLGRQDQYAIFINFNIDTVYRQQGGLPNMNRMYNFPGQPIDLLDRFSSSVIIKADM